MSDKAPFKVAFPSVILPERFGGRRAAVIFGVSHKDQMNVALCTCIDENGTPHFNVPFTRQELMGSRPMVLVEDPNARAPTVGGGAGLVGPQGQKL
jgi:hypothetical protein